MITNEEFLKKVERIVDERGITLYELKKDINDDILKDSTYYSMFNKRSTARIEYICEISRALDMSTAEMIGEENKDKYLKPVQMEILEEFEGLDETMIRRILPIVKGLVLAEKSKK